MKAHLTHTEGTNHLGRHILSVALVMRDSNLEIGLKGEWTKGPVGPGGSNDVLQEHSDTLALKSGRSNRGSGPFTIDLNQNTLGIAGIDNLETLSINIKYV